MNSTLGSVVPLAMFLYRTVLLLWGVNKFTKKLREDDPIPTNEIDNLVDTLANEY